MGGGFYSRKEIEGIVNKLRSPSLVAGAGKVFYIDGFAGSDSNPPDNPGKPLKTITTALSLCKNDRDDYIIVLDCWDQEPAFPIVVDKSRVHIIGLSIPSMNLYAQLQGGTNNIFALNANYIEIAGFGFVSIGASGIITGSAGSSYGQIHHCTFATAALSLLNGINISGGQMGNMLIEKNILGTNITGNGMTGQFVNCIIRDNIFRGIAGKCLNLGGVEIGAILRNYFFSPIAETLAAGWAIDLAAGANGGIIAGNKASACGDASGNNPYKDRSSNAVGTLLNGWADNFDGPALSAGPDTA